ncbi:MAG: T9SS type A sorting domain-containing protein, partial [Bacteroidota bacterium]
FTNSIYTQITFKKVFPSTAIDPFKCTVTCIPLLNNKSFIVSTFAGTSTLFLTKINSIGNFVAEKRFLLYMSDYCNFFFNDNKTLTLYSTYWYNKELFKLDTSLNVISAMQYDSINWWQAVNSNVICHTFNKGFLLSGGKGISMPLIVKTDSSGNITWSKYFSTIQGGIQDFVQTQDSGFVIAANLKNLGTSLIKTDSSGNVLWSKSYFRPQGYIHNVLENTDGTMIITGNVDSSIITSPLFFVKLNEAGNVIWAKTFGDAVNNIRTFASDTKHTQDGGFITLATLAIDTWLDDLLLIKTNANGDTMWVRAHGSPQSWDYGQSVEQLNDDGYIISGITNNNIPVTLSSLYLIRTDSLGHTDSLCEEYSPSIAINSITVNDSDITVTSVPFTVTTSIPDTSTQSFITYAYDGCHLDEIPELFAEQAAPLLIYPNPTDGLFSIETKMSTPTKTEIEIYNINGAKIYFSITNESAINIDLSGYSRGLYFVKMSNAKFVKTGKVMVQ